MEEKRKEIMGFACATIFGSGLRTCFHGSGFALLSE